MEGMNSDMEERMRADAALKARGLAASRERAQALIAAGLAAVNGRPIEKPAQKVGPEDVLTVRLADGSASTVGGAATETAETAYGIFAANGLTLTGGGSLTVSGAFPFFI